MSDIKIGLIGGTGLGQALGAESVVARHEVDTPFGKPSDVIVQTQWAGLPVFLLSRHGPGHLLNPTNVPFRANIFALRQLGVTHIVASGAVGSLRDEFKPRDLVIPDQVIDKTHKRAGTFYDQAAVHVEFAEPFCPALRRLLLEAGREVAQGSKEDSGCRVQGSAEPSGATPSSLNPEPRTANPFNVHDRGCYVCMEGPAFSSRAESLMHRLWGGDLIGMTAMPEAKLAREAEISYALVALVTDYDCWRHQPAAISPGAAQAAHAEPPDPAALLKEILGNLQAATSNAMAVVRRAVELIADRRDQFRDLPAHRALQLAIWSDKSRIPAGEVQRLGPLWMRYFESATAGGGAPAGTQAAPEAPETAAAPAEGQTPLEAGPQSTTVPSDAT